MNIISSIWNYRCPRCRKGEVFTAPFDMKKPLDMHSHCDQCGLNLHPEPGYFYGAMFISYIWTAFLCLFIVGFCMLVLGWGVNASMAMLIFIMALLFFLALRISRIIYLHLDVQYDPEAIDRFQRNKE